MLGQVRLWSIQPGVQSEHAVLPDVPVYLPGSHRSHFSVSAAAPNEPGKHGAGSALPTEQAVPAGQTTHWSREERKPVMLRTVWLACVPPRHGCGALLPSTQR